MTPPDKFLSTFDKFLFGGLGCGVVVLCVLGGWIFYILNKLPVIGSAETQVARVDFPTATISAPELSTPNLFPTSISTLDSSPSSVPIPSHFDGTEQTETAPSMTSRKIAIEGLWPLSLIFPLI